MQFYVSLNSTTFIVLNFPALAKLLICCRQLFSMQLARWHSGSSMARDKKTNGSGNDSKSPCTREEGSPARSSLDSEPVPETLDAACEIAFRMMQDLYIYDGRVIYAYKCYCKWCGKYFLNSFAFSAHFKHRHKGAEEKGSNAFEERREFVETEVREQLTKFFNKFHEKEVR